MPFDPTFEDRPPILYYLADLATRPTGHDLVSRAAPYILWRRPTASMSPTPLLVEALMLSAAELARRSLVDVLPVPAALAARLAIRSTGERPGQVVINHAHIWAALEAELTEVA